MNELEPLDFDTDLGAIDTSNPVPKEGDHVVTCLSVTQVQTAAGKPMWKLVLTLDNPSLSHPTESGTSVEIPAGFQLFENILMYQVDNPKAPDYRTKVAKVYDAFMGTDNATRPGNYGDLRPAAGRKAVVRIKPKVDPKGEYGLQANIASWKPFNG